MDKVLLLIDKKDNRRLLADWLTNYYEVIEASPENFEEYFDLCIADGSALERYWQWVKSKKEISQPIFQPFMLITARPGVSIITRQLWEVIDELAIMPIDKVELRARIEVLLRERHRSVELKQRFDDAISEIKTSAKLDSTLNDINLAVTSTFDIDTIMQRIVDEGVKALGADNAAISLRKEDRWVVSFVTGFPKDLIGIEMVDEEERHAVLASQTKTPIAIDDAFNDERVNREHMKSFGIRSVLAVPISVREETLGVAFFNHTSTKHKFTDSEISFAVKVGTIASLALENARLYDVERNIADTLQKALLTIPDRIEGLEYSYIYRSATEATKVGGDFFDIFELENNRVGIMVGDVSGKGLEAASITSLARNTLRAYAYENESPAVILEKTNEVIHKSIPASMFITLFFGIIDMNSGSIVYCSAGHPPTLLKRKMAGVESLEVTGPILGAFSKARYRDSSGLIEKGDILLLYTDGITEARCNGGFYDEDRLVSMLSSIESASAKDIPRVIFDNVMECASGRLNDDAILLSLALVR
jgi:hypothetical protein